MKSLVAFVYKAAVLVVVVVPLLATVFAMRLLWQRAVNWTDVILLLVMYSLVALGVTIGFHRMLTHRSFKPHPAVKLVLLILGSMSVEGAALDWAATHIKHHAQADREGDPHSPVEGFFHSHVGWLFKDRMADPNVYCRYLLKDPIVVFVSRTFLLWVVVSLVIPFAIGGWTGLLWGGLVRMFLTHHVTWSVNSVCHVWGHSPFKTADHSANNFPIAIVSLGEGWHNNHHAFPASARHGLHWWQFDATYILIRAMSMVGIAWDIRTPGQPAMQAKLKSPAPEPH